MDDHPINALHTGEIPASWVTTIGKLGARPLLGLLAEVDRRGVAHDDLPAVRRVWDDLVQHGTAREREIDLALRELGIQARRLRAERQSLRDARGAGD